MTDELQPDPPSEEQLIARISARGPGSGEALRELAARGSPEARRVLASVLGTRGYPVDMRGAAAVALGRHVDGSGQAALEAALADDAPAVVRRAAEALGRIGDVAALARLKAARLPEDPAGRRAVLFARQLLACRHGLEDGTAPAGPEFRTLLVPTDGTADLRPSALEPSARRRVTEVLADELPAIPVALEGAVQLSCGDNVFIALPHARAAESVRGSFVPAVVLKRAQSLDRFALYLYVLSHPAGERRLRLSGYRPDGTLTCRGEATLGGRAPGFRLEALDTPYTPPIRIEGHLEVDGPRLAITTALVGPVPRTVVPRSRIPQRSPAPKLS